MSWRDLTALAAHAANATFGEPALYTSKDGVSRMVSVIYDPDHYTDPLPDAQTTQTMQHQFGVLACNFASQSPQPDDRITIIERFGGFRKERTFVVTQSQPDGHAHLRLICTEAREQGERSGLVAPNDSQPN